MEALIVMQRIFPHSLADLETFNRTCRELFKKMIITVPAHVILTDAVKSIVKYPKLFLSPDLAEVYTFSLLACGLLPSRSHAY